MRNKRADVTTDVGEIKVTISEYFVQLFGNNIFENLKEIDDFQAKYNDKIHPRRNRNMHRPIAT